MVKIRLARHGKRNDPFYRIVAIDSQKKREGKNIEILGFWHPRENNKKINKKALEAWIKKGAQISPSVQNLLNN
jgi:small subunit ribosomal protein S16